MLAKLSSIKDALTAFSPSWIAREQTPYEILLTVNEMATGKIKYREKYIGSFESEKKGGIVIAGENIHDGTIMRTINNTCVQWIDIGSVGGLRLCTAVNKNNKREQKNTLFAFPDMAHQRIQISQYLPCSPSTLIIASGRLEDGSGHMCK